MLVASGGEDAVEAGAGERGARTSSAHVCEGVEGDATTQTLPPLVDLGALCPADFNVRPEARDVFGEMTRFAAPVDVWQLFENMSVPLKIQLLEANFVRV